MENRQVKTTDRTLEVRANLEAAYPDVLTPDAMGALDRLARFDSRRKAVMASRIARRRERAARKQPIAFLDDGTTIAGTVITVKEARAGHFAGDEIPPDLRRQWIQGTGPAARPNAPVEAGLRNVAYALLSGADGWMFDGEDALGLPRRNDSTTCVCVGSARARMVLLLSRNSSTSRPASVSAGTSRCTLASKRVIHNVVANDGPITCPIVRQNIVSEDATPTSS